jgi:UDP-N-acetylmuramate dehydrogenase
MTAMKIQENVLLAPFTTFRIGGAARFFVQAQNIADIEKAIAFAQEEKEAEKRLPIFILGGGSNVLISDSGFNGLVIKNELKGIVEEEVVDTETGESCTRIIAGAGESWDGLVKYAVEEKGLYGLENLSSIPGTVGASPVQNIGAYGVEVKNTIEWVEVYNPITKKIEKLSNEECRFGYRDSIFKHERKENIILRVAFLLKKEGKIFIEYKDLKNYFAGRTDVPSLREVRDATIKVRARKFPDLSKFGTAGSFFRNIVIPKTDYQELTKKYPQAPAFLVDAYRAKQAQSEKMEKEMVKVPTAWVLDKVCGFRGVRRGEVGVFENQALVLVNFGKGTAQEIKTLAGEMIYRAKEKTGITISPEVEFIG